MNEVRKTLHKCLHRDVTQLFIKYQLLLKRVGGESVHPDDEGANGVD